MLHSGRPNDVIYALWQLDQMTGAPGNGRVRSIYSDFGRQQIWAAAHEFITNPNPEIAKMAIGLIGAHNPYMHTADPGEDLAGISATWPVSLTGFTLTLWDLTPLGKRPNGQCHPGTRDPGPRAGQGPGARDAARTLADRSRPGRAQRSSTLARRLSGSRDA